MGAHKDAALPGAQEGGVRGAAEDLHWQSAEEPTAQIDLKQWNNSIVVVSTVYICYIVLCDEITVVFVV